MRNHLYAGPLHHTIKFPELCKILCGITLSVCDHLKDDNNVIKQKTIRLSILLWFNTKHTFCTFFQKLINLYNYRFN